MQFNVARGHRKAVPTIQLHERRKYRHQHNQDKYDFGQLIHCFSLKQQLPSEIARTTSLGNWGEYSIQFLIYKVLLRNAASQMLPKTDRFPCKPLITWLLPLRHQITGFSTGELENF
jgi:hypothetical protein